MIYIIILKVKSHKIIYNVRPYSTAAPLRTFFTRATPGKPASEAPLLIKPDLSINRFKLKQPCEIANPKEGARPAKLATRPRIGYASRKNHRRRGRPKQSGGRGAETSDCQETQHLQEGG